MGLITPILVHNDAVPDFSDDPEQLVSMIESAVNKSTPEYIPFYVVKRPKWWQFWRTNKVNSIDCNAIETLGSRHSDNISVIVVNGNSWTELQVCSEVPRNLDHMKQVVAIAQAHVTAMKKRIKQWETANK